MSYARDVRLLLICVTKLLTLPLKLLYFVSNRYLCTKMKYINERGYKG